MPQKTKLDREAEPVAAAPFGADERQILRAEHVMFGHLAGFSRDTKQSRTLFSGKQGSAGHWVSGLMRRPGHKPIAIRDHSETGFRKQIFVQIRGPAMRCANGRL